MAITISHKINLLPKMISQKASLHIPSRGFQRGFLQIEKLDFDICLCFYDLTHSLLVSCQSSFIPTYVTHSLNHSLIHHHEIRQPPTSMCTTPKSSTSNFLNFQLPYGHHCRQGHGGHQTGSQKPFFGISKNAGQFYVTF